MKRVMIVLVLVLTLVAGLELSGCRKPSGTKKVKKTTAKKVEKTTETRPTADLESLLEQDQDIE